MRWPLLLTVNIVAILAAIQPTAANELRSMSGTSCSVDYGPAWMQDPPRSRKPRKGDTDDPRFLFSAPTVCSYAPRGAPSWSMTQATSNNKALALQRVEQRYATAQPFAPTEKLGVEQRGYVVANYPDQSQGVVELYVGRTNWGDTFMVALNYRRPAQTMAAHSALHAAFVAQSKDWR